jgi:hypothetical protein
MPAYPGDVTVEGTAGRWTRFGPKNAGMWASGRISIIRLAILVSENNRQARRS